MALRIKELQSIVKNALNEEANVSDLRKEVTRVLGPSVIVEGSLARVAEEANDRLEVLERTGRSRSISFKSSVMSKLIESRSVEARKLAARTLPVNLLKKLMNDSDPSVRALVARQLPTHLVKEMLRRSPEDDQVRDVYRQKRLDEAGLPTPKEQMEPFDYHGEKRLGDAVKQNDGPELSDVFYETLAHKIILDYGGNIEGGWEETAVHRYVSSTKATSNVDIDEARLYKAVKEQLEEKEDRALERGSLKELAKRLRIEADGENLNEGFSGIIEEEVDQVELLMGTSLSINEFVDRANALFLIKESTAPKAIKKYRVNEGSTGEYNVPCIGTLPHAHGFRPVDERALDMYCKHWNTRQAMSGEPLRLEWSTHPGAMNKISFNVTLR